MAWVWSAIGSGTCLRSPGWGRLCWGCLWVKERGLCGRSCYWPRSRENEGSTGFSFDQIFNYILISLFLNWNVYEIEPYLWFELSISHRCYLSDVCDGMKPRIGQTCMRGSMFQSPVASPCLVDISKQTARRIDLYARSNASITYHVSLSRSLIDILKIDRA